MRARAVAVLGFLVALTAGSPVASADWGAGACTNLAGGVEVLFYNEGGPNAFVGVYAPVPGRPGLATSPGAMQC